jgi:hypothetical protein
VSIPKGPGRERSSKKPWKWRQARREVKRIAGDRIRCKRFKDALSTAGNKRNYELVTVFILIALDDTDEGGRKNEEGGRTTTTTNVHVRTF